MCEAPVGRTMKAQEQRRSPCRWNRSTFRAVLTRRSLKGAGSTVWPARAIDPPGPTHSSRLTVLCSGLFPAATMARGTYACPGPTTSFTRKLPTSPIVQWKPSRRVLVALVPMSSRDSIQSPSCSRRMAVNGCAATASTARFLVRSPRRSARTSVPAFPGTIIPQRRDKIRGASRAPMAQVEPPWRMGGPSSFSYGQPSTKLMISCDTVVLSVSRLVRSS